MTSNTQRYIQIDEDGYLISDGLRITDEEYGHAILSGLVIDERRRIFTRYEDTVALVEAFDQPLVVRQVSREGKVWSALMPYGYRCPFQLSALSLDEWDRFHGVTDKDIPFVFSRPAQAQFFNLLDDYSDDSITDSGETLTVGPWLIPSRAPDQEDFWSKIYQTEQPGWELGREAAALPEIIPQIKIPRSRVIVLGCGSGHDAAYFAKQGHIVTGVDMSPEALRRARDLYGNLPGLKFVEADVFALGKEFDHKFDLVFEHTCYCAVSPDRRNDLVKVWRRLLAGGGHLLGVFFTMPKRQGPPWGGSEWEIRERLKSSFDFRFWTRWRHSVEKRQGVELVVYAQLK